MTRIAILGGVVLALATSSVGLGAAGPAKIAAGCWLGKGVHAGAFASGPVNGTVTSGTIELHLWVGKGGSDAVGLLRTGGIGKGTLKLSGSKLALTVLMKGRFDVTGSASKLVVNGTDRWNGKAKGSGQLSIDIPVSLKLPVKNAPLVIVAVQPSRITLRYGKAAFVANRVKQLPDPVGELCS